MTQYDLEYEEYTSEEGTHEVRLEMYRNDSENELEFMRRVLKKKIEIANYLTFRGWIAITEHHDNHKIRFPNPNRNRR